MPLRTAAVLVVLHASPTSKNMLARLQSSHRDLRVSTQWMLND